MLKNKKYIKRFDEINVIPFIDIMLVLLVIVLTTATFIKQGVIPIDLPQASQSDTKKQLKEIVLYVDAKGDIFFQKKKISLVHLEIALKKIKKNQIIVLRSDKSSQFKDFVSIMNLLKKLQLKEFYIATKTD